MTEKSRTILLAISLAVNVFVLGAVAGGAYMWNAYDHSKVAAGRGLRFAAEDLSPIQQKALRRMLMQARRDSGSDIESARTARTELARLITQKSLDRTAIDTQLSAIRTADIALRTNLERAVIDFAETLTPAERQTFVEGLKGRGAMLRRTKPGKT